jgi:hypothetical protein
MAIHHRPRSRLTVFLMGLVGLILLILFITYVYTADRAMYTLRKTHPPELCSLVKIFGSFRFFYYSFLRAPPEGGALLFFLV